MLETVTFSGYIRIDSLFRKPTADGYLSIPRVSIGSIEFVLGPIRKYLTTFVLIVP